MAGPVTTGRRADDRLLVWNRRFLEIFPWAQRLTGPHRPFLPIREMTSVYRSDPAGPRVRVATADVQASAIDTSTGDPCGRIGTLVVTPPNNVEPRLLEVYLPICDATISSVG